MNASIVLNVDVVVSSFHCAFLALETGTGELSDKLEFLVRVREIKSRLLHRLWFQIWADTIGAAIQGSADAALVASGHRSLANTSGYLSELLDRDCAQRQDTLFRPTFSGGEG